MHPQSTTTSSATQPPAVSGIYRIANSLTGDFYIGSSTNIRTRWMKHRSYLKRHKHPNVHLQAVWNSAGAAALSITVLEEVEPTRLFSVEQTYLDRERPPYNMSRQAWGGPRIKEHSAASRALISAKVRAAGQTEEHKRKLAEHLATVRRGAGPERLRKMWLANAGSKRSLETRAKVSAGNRGRPVSAETRAKIGAANKAAWHARPRVPMSAEQRTFHSDYKREWWRQYRERQAQHAGGSSDGSVSECAAYRQLPLPGT